MSDKPELYLKKMTKEEKEQLKEEGKKVKKPKALIIMIIVMVAIMAGMFFISYIWSMGYLPGAIAFPVMVICLIAEIVVCDRANRMNRNLEE